MPCRRWPRKPGPIQLGLFVFRRNVTADEYARYKAPASSTLTKTDTPLLDVPQSVTVVTRDAINDQAMNSLAYGDSRRTRRNDRAGRRQPRPAAAARQ